MILEGMKVNVGKKEYRNLMNIVGNQHIYESKDEGKRDVLPISCTLGTNAE